VERALAPLAIGLMAAGVYTVARSGVTDWPTAAFAAGAGILLAKRWLPAAPAVLAAGAVGWLLGV
jgi:chromate transport protein ChrA